MEPAQEVGPPCLIFVTVPEMDMCVSERTSWYRQFLQSDNGDLDRCTWPGVVINQLAAHTFQKKLNQRSKATGMTDASYSASSKIRCSSRSTIISNPESISFLAVVGVSAARRSNSFFSQRSQKVGFSDIFLLCKVVWKKNGGYSSQAQGWNPRLSGFFWVGGKWYVDRGEFLCTPDQSARSGSADLLRRPGNSENQ